MSASPNQGCKGGDWLNGKKSPSGWLRASDHDLDRFLVRGSIANLRGKGTPTADVLPKWLVGSLLDGDEVLALKDQVEIKGVLLQKRPAKVVPSLNGGHVK